MEKRIVAAWESKSGKHTATLYLDAFGYTYTGCNCGGSILAESDEDAISQLQAKVDSGYFQPDANVTPMRRTKVHGTCEPYALCSKCIEAMERWDGNEA